MRRFRGAALFHGPRPSSSQGAPFWPSGLTVRRSRPPTAAAELRALVPSYSASCRPPLTPALCLSPRFLLGGFGALRGFACVRFGRFKPFWPLAPVYPAPPAIFLAALRRFRGAALFHGPRPSSGLGAPFWPSGLTVRRSRPPTAAAELRALANFPFNRLLQMRNLILITCATLILSACASPARYAWVKEGASDHQRTSDTSECTYQVRLNKTPTAEQKDLHSLCMQGKGYRLKRVG